jgi:hypothetical protein
MNTPVSERAIAATDPLLVFFPTAASTLILIMPCGGGSQPGAGCASVAGFTSFFCLLSCRSLTNLCTKQYVDNGLWYKQSDHVHARSWSYVLLGLHGLKNAQKKVVRIKKGGRETRARAGRTDRVEGPIAGSDQSTDYEHFPCF